MPQSAVDGRATTGGAASPNPWAVRRSRVVRGARRLPATLGVVALLIVVGVIGGGLWSPVTAQPWWEQVAYGLPALQGGRWWTVVTGTFFVISPILYAPTLAAFAGMAFLEWKRGSRLALAFFGGGQLLAVLGAALGLLAASGLPWPWAVRLAGDLDVGPSGGAMACIAACAGLLPSPWRQRLWIAVFGYATVGLLFIGTIADVEHAIAVLVVLAVSRSFRIARASVRERRQLAFAAALALGAVQVITLAVPTDGPFGATAAFDGPWIDVVLETVVILLVANALRLGRRWAWIATVVVAAANVARAAVYVAPTGIAPSDIQLGWGDIDVAVAASVLWLAFLAYLVAARRAFGSRGRRPLGSTGRRDASPRPTADDARRLIRESGGGSLSWMATWAGMEYLPTEGGLVPYQRHLGVAIALADPLGPAAGISGSVDAFVRAAERDALIPCFFSASAPTRDAMPPGWRSLIIADDTIVDLPGLAFTGKPWSHVRTALNRAEREGVSFRMTRMQEETWGVRQQLRAISESWVGEKDLPEMRFTLGTLQEAEDPEVRLAVAVSAVGDVEGFLTWLPVYGVDGRPRGWTLDLMRRRDGGFPPVMEFLIGASARHFAEEGAEVLSLSGAPLAHRPTADEGPIARVLGQLSDVLEPLYGFAALHRFKLKFNPRFEPIFLLYRDEGDLARIGPALVRAFLPDATLRQFAAAGIDMVRGD